MDVSLAYIVSGHDENFAQQVHARHFYQHEEIRWHHAYVDTLYETGADSVEVDFGKFHDTRPLGGGADGAWGLVPEQTSADAS